MALVITARADGISDLILKQMQRGVTSLQGQGMYTHHVRAVMLVALTVTEVPQLKALVSEHDPEAFVIIVPAQEVLGRGFRPLQS